MISELTLKNFRKHAEGCWSFGPGLNVIAGPNWAGKTTLQLAIAYALFGARATGITASELIRDGESKMEVGLKLTISGESLEVVRGPNKAELKAGGGSLLATGQGPVTAAIEEKLGVAAGDFLAFHRTKQEEASSLISLGVGKLNQYVERLTGLPLVDDILETLNSRIKVAAVNLIAMEDVSQNFERLLAARDTSSATLEERLKASEELQGVYNLLAEGAAHRRSLYDQLQAHMTAHLEASKKRAAAQAVVDSLGAQILQLGMNKPDSPPREEPIPDERIQEALDLVSKVQQRDALEGAIPGAEQSLASWEAYRQGLLPEKQEVSFQVVYDARVAQSLAEEHARAAHRQVANSLCEACMRPMDGADIDRLQVAADQADADLALKKTFLTNAEKAYADYTAWETSWKQAVEAVESWASALQGYRNQLDGLVSEVGALQEADAMAHVTKMQESNETLRLRKEAHQNHETQMEQLADLLNKAHAAFAACPDVIEVSQEDLKRAREDMLNDEDALLQSSGLLAVANEQVAAEKARLESLESELSRVQGSVEKVSQQKKTVADMKELQKYLKDNRSLYLREVWGRLLGYANRFIVSATFGGVEALERDDSGTFLYVENGVRRKVEEQASGAQLAIFSTALKLALVSALGSALKLLMLDEVTASAREDVSMAIATELRQAGDQVLLVTHRQEDSAVADTLIAL